MRPEGSAPGARARELTERSQHLQHHTEETRCKTPSKACSSPPEQLEVPDQAKEYTKVNGDGDMPNKYDEI